ncbi:hypothetical protein CcaverHIS002_0605190 [Cutaneotrichosporon cavernicola]|nr:hypothetical protein CcaverHIS002_0605190 [Cutaneotrichosporon cavernicola]
MPPRKRARRSGVEEPTPTSTPPPSQPPGTQRIRTVPAPGRNRYRTRHRRDVRGPELAELEGGRADLVPPSDDEEYDEWRAVRAVERAEQARAEAEATSDVEELFTMPGSPRRRDHLPSQSPPVPAMEPEAPVPPHPPPDSELADETKLSRLTGPSLPRRSSLPPTSPVRAPRHQQEGLAVTSPGGPVAASWSPNGPLVEVNVEESQLPAVEVAVPADGGMGSPMDAEESQIPVEAVAASPSPAHLGLGSLMSVEESQLPIPHEMREEEAWGMDLDVVEDAPMPIDLEYRSRSPTPSFAASVPPQPVMDLEVFNYPPATIELDPGSQSGRESLARSVAPQPSPALRPPPSSPDAVDLLAANRASQSAPVRPPPSQTRDSHMAVASVADTPQPFIDPALLQFRFVRTFRTRTALQLQPYTKEKQQYENALRKGGLAKGRRAVAPSAEIRAANEPDKTQTQDDDSSSYSEATPPDAIVIGGTQDQAQPRRLEPKPLVDADYDEYFLEFGEVVEEEDEVCQKRLQVIARKRLRVAKEARRKERAAERTRRGFEALMKETEKEREAERKKEAEKRKAEREKAAQRVTAEKQRKAAANQERERESNARRGGTTQSVSKRTSMLAVTAREKSVPKVPRSSTVRRDRGGSVGGKAGASLMSETSVNHTPGVPGRPVTYSRRQQRPVVELSDSPLSSPPPSPSPSQRQVPLLPSDIRPRVCTPALTSPLDRARPPTVSSGMVQVDIMDLGGGLDDFGDGIDDIGGNNYGDFIGSADGKPATPRRLSSPPVVPTSRSTRRRRIVSSSSHSSDGDASDSSQLQFDKRRRIAERMLPRAMLKRLEQEATQQKRRKDDRRRRAARVDDSPVRPGHAVVRRRGGGALDDMGDLFNDELESDEGGGMIGSQAEEGNESEASPDEDLGRQLILTLQSDSDGSEAIEDNGRPAALARLQRGDFEAIVHGRRSMEPRERRPARGELRNHRPALRITKHPAKHRQDTDGLSAPTRRVLDESQLYQTRLDFSVEGKTPGNRHKAKSDGSKSKSKHHRGDRTSGGSSRGGRGAVRPAIRLDDSVIFATGDFAFSSDSEDIEVMGETLAPRAPLRGPLAQMTVKAGRLYARTTSSPTPAPLQQRRPAAERQLDEGVGKARSWANFDRFPIDFEITPLPMGVYCCGESIPGSGRLGRFLGQLDGEFLDEPRSISAYGVSLHSEMASDEALEVLPIVIDGMVSSIHSFIDVSSAASAIPDLVPLRFFRDYLARADSDKRENLFLPFNNLGQRLNDIFLDSRRVHRHLVLHLLEVRYALLEIVAIAGDRESVFTAATRLISLLLVYGFDRTVRPLRRILSGQADTPEVSDVTVALWVSLLHILAAYDKQHPPPTSNADDTFSIALADALDRRYSGEVGPLAAERIWFLVFGLCAISQFGLDGTVVADYTPFPRWALVKRALGHIKITHSQEVEEAAHLGQLQGRDRYIKTVVARCLRLSSTWRWYFDSRSFSVATRDLGMIFKARQHRNLPTEAPVDFPRFIADFDISLTAADDTRRASAFELWLRLACVAASDLIGAAEELSAAHRAERDVQRLIMSIFPLSAVPFTRTNLPTPKQLGALVNRYSTMVVACYFSPSLLPWLLANSRKWLAFDTADFESRQICIRGLMYLGVACRHHSHPLDTVVGQLADILATLQAELEQLGRSTKLPGFPTGVEIERTMVLVVSCFRQIILHPGYTQRVEPVYPDPVLLHESWTARIFQLDLVKDVKSGLEIVATIQAFLDQRGKALPKRARVARSSRQQESVDDYPSLGFDFDAIDLAALGGDEAPEDPIERQDAAFADTIVTVICPRIYRLLSDMLPASESEEPAKEKGAERLVFINRLTQCWSDCAAIAVVEHQRLGWDVYLARYGQQSWSRIGNELGRIRVGLQFMTNVAHTDPGAFRTHEDEFILLLFQGIVTDRLTIEHKYTSAFFALPGAMDHMLFEGVRAVGVEDLSRSAFMEKRIAILEVVFRNIPGLLSSHLTPAGMKALIWQCINVLVASIVMYEAAIDAHRVLHRQGYRVFAMEVVCALRRYARGHINENAVPGLKTLTWA